MHTEKGELEKSAGISKRSFFLREVVGCIVGNYTITGELYNLLAFQGGALPTIFSVPSLLRTSLWIIFSSTFSKYISAHFIIIIIY
jgi:hypothetical protein